MTAIFGSVEARAGITLASGNGAAGELCWVEIDLKRGKTNGMATVHVEIGVDSKRIIRRWVIEVPGEWKTFRFPFVLNQVERDVSCFVGPAGRAFAAGAKGTVRVGRIRAYQHSRPVRDLADRGVSPDNGDAGKRLSPLRDAAVQVWDSHLTQDRVVELATDQVYTGAKFRIVRRARASGAAQLRIATSPVQVLRKASTWCDVEFSNGVWIATGSGVL
ncbi:hypothetical protein [Novosphingobium sp. MBES04]|uniref:hypothetical protein n=1 Tax=Novosphingobium sp. MBES04 TaxID=1206458 RepID=UPI001184A1DE|nr:hypothetical protein [Novosphingobium sp. MBES04]